MLEQGSTDVNGPHQGAIVDTPTGEWWFFHFQSHGALGRVVHLQPMHWQDDWPVIGVDIDRNGIGEPVRVWTMPVKSGKPSLPQTNDDFESVMLSPQWQWNHNPVNEAWSLTENRGQLTLHGLYAENFRKARNTLTQKVMGYKSMATIALDCSELAEGGRAGLVCMGRTNQQLGVMRKGGKLCLYRGDDQQVLQIQTENPRRTVFLRISFDMKAKQYQFAYSSDNKQFIPIGDPFFVDAGYWKGVRFGIYHYNIKGDGGIVKMPWAKYHEY